MITSMDVLCSNTSHASGKSLGGNLKPLPPNAPTLRIPDPVVTTLEMVRGNGGEHAKSSRNTR